MLKLALKLLSAVFAMMFAVTLVVWVGGKIFAQPYTDMLAYISYNYARETSFLYLYDPDRSLSAVIYDKNLFPQLSLTGLIAFTDENNEINLLDINNLTQPPTQINHIADTSDYRLDGWSPDGRYLAVEACNSELEKPPMQLVWDNQTQEWIDITPSNVVGQDHYYYANWGPDGRLLFRKDSRGLPSEIYIWDGQGTMNLSQNLEGGIRFPTANVDGEIAFVSEQGDTYSIYVWDGVSMRDGIPDTTSFITVVTDLEDSMIAPVWTYDNQLMFVYQSQIYLWDRQTIHNISQNRNVKYSNLTWSQNSYWTFVENGTYGSDPTTIVDDKNNHIQTVDAFYSPIWSTDEHLAFCQGDFQGMAVWNGEKVTQVATGWQIIAQWQGGNEQIHCIAG